MKPFLMSPDRDFDLEQKLPGHAEAVTADLELQTLFDAMSAGDGFVLEVARKAVLCPATDLETILHRQAVMRDCIGNPAVVREIYALALQAIETERKNYLGIFSKSPSMILHRSIQVVEMFLAMLLQLRVIAEVQSAGFSSNGFTVFFSMLEWELDDDYLASVREHLETLQFSRGIPIGARLGAANKGIEHILRKPRPRRLWWLELLFPQAEPGFTFHVAGRDESGTRALAELRETGLALAADALGQAAEHVLDFWRMLRIELAFYIGCLNLHDQLTRRQIPLSFPIPLPGASRRHAFTGLRDPHLALRRDQGVVGNDLEADEKTLVVVTGANQGGKTTFLRSIGIAQLMLQSGMFVAAESFRADLCDRVLTHFKREEDRGMNSGKLDEELDRMDQLVDAVTPNSLLLFNESFAATNEREGSEIARQITRGLTERRVKIFFVTHLYDFAHRLYAEHPQPALFLRAERRPDGARTFKIVEGEPLETSYGQDLYRKIFRVAVELAPAGATAA